jgi:hypothetical protein
MARQAVLELNPKHPPIKRLNRVQGRPHIGEWAQVLFNQAVLTLGAGIEDPTTFVRRLNTLLTALTDEGRTPEAASGQRPACHLPGNREFVENLRPSPLASHAPEITAASEPHWRVLAMARYVGRSEAYSRRID